MTSAFAEVIGDPIEHSKSPLIHGFWLGELKIDAEYRRYRVRRDELADYLSTRRSDPAWRGCNVTMPLKLDALGQADDSSDRAIATGAANILVPRDGRLWAGNTDVGAIQRLLARLAGSGTAMESVTLIGSGGAARASLMALHLAGISDVRIHARDLKRAYALAVQFGLDAVPRGIDAPVSSDGLINATPLGMTGAPPLNVDLAAISAKGWILDFVTSPSPTVLLERAKERGLTVIDGIDLLVEQAAASFSLLFGADPPRDRDDQLFARLRS